MRGQHLYLAVTVRSSSHPKTNKYWGSVWLSLALNTNYIWMYSWKWVNTLLRPFCTHFSYPQSRILSPFCKLDQISQFWPDFTILTKSHNFDQISQFWPIFTIWPIWTKFHILDQISHVGPNFTFCPNLTILKKFYNFEDKNSQFWPNLTIFGKQCRQYRQCRHFWQF